MVAVEVQQGAQIMDEELTALKADKVILEQQLKSLQVQLHSHSRHWAQFVTNSWSRATDDRDMSTGEGSCGGGRGQEELRGRWATPKGYFELKMLICDYQVPTVAGGFLSAAFPRVLGASDTEVGDDGYSWAVDGNYQYTKHNDEKGEYSCTWKKDDVVELVCDLENMQLHVSVNGCFDAPNGLLFTLSSDAVRDGLFAAFTGKRGKLRYNMGEAPFKYTAPSDDYKGFVEFGSNVKLEHLLWLHATSRTGDAARVALLIQSGANVNARDKVIVYTYTYIYMCMCVNIYIRYRPVDTHTRAHICVHSHQRHTPKIHKHIVSTFKCVFEETLTHKRTRVFEETHTHKCTRATHV